MRTSSSLLNFLVWLWLAAFWLVAFWLVVSWLFISSSQRSSHQLFQNLRRAIPSRAQVSLRHIHHAWRAGEGSAPLLNRIPGWSRHSCLRFSPANPPASAAEGKTSLLHGVPLD